MNSFKKLRTFVVVYQIPVINDNGRLVERKMKYVIIKAETSNGAAEIWRLQTAANLPKNVQKIEQITMLVCEEERK